MNKRTTTTTTTTITKITGKTTTKHSTVMHAVKNALRLHA